MRIPFAHIFSFLSFRYTNVRRLLSSLVYLLISRYCHSELCSAACPVTPRRNSVSITLSHNYSESFVCISSPRQRRATKHVRAVKVCAHSGSKAVYDDVTRALGAYGLPPHHERAVYYYTPPSPEPPSCSPLLLSVLQRAACRHIPASCLVSSLLSPSLADAYFLVVSLQPHDPFSTLFSHQTTNAYNSWRE